MRIGIDTGGTFTDLAAVTPGRPGHPEQEGTLEAKVPSTPDDPSRAVLDALAAADAQLGPDAGGPAGARPKADLVHGTTVALNAVLTGRVACAALVTNEGFQDLIEIGRQDRADLYALEPVKPTAMIPRERRFELAQRSWPALVDTPDGPRPDVTHLVETSAPSARELTRLTRQVKRSGASSVAVCLLHSYADPSIETRVAEALAPLGLPVTCSAEILPSYREVERFSTACVNAALVPVVRAYLERLSTALGSAKRDLRLSILQSSGGTLPAERAALEPVRVLFSGPAGGVVGAARAAAEAGLAGIATLDMGGTSTDVAFHDPALGLGNTVADARIAGHPVAVPTLDVHTVGCGGGSLVRVDRGGVLHVGPESAGADPGPVCYGRGSVPTVTDAHVLLGHIRAGGFLDGHLQLDTDAVTRAFERLGQDLGVPALEAASGVLDVAHAAMRRAVGVMTMQRGHDPRGLGLVAFGGAGGLAAASVAASLEMPGALVPARPGVLSAWGMASADAVSDHPLTVLEPLARWSAARRKRAFLELARAGRAALKAAGFRPGDIELETSLDLRYAGQSFELSLTESKDPAAAFAARHQERYGWRLDSGEVELVALRLRALVRSQSPAAQGPRPRRRSAPRAAQRDTRQAVFAGRPLPTPVYERAALAPGHVVKGPAILEEFSGTTLVPPGWMAQVTRGAHLWLAPE